METIVIDKVTSIEELAERVRVTGRGLTLTRDGAPVADIVPHDAADAAAPTGRLKFGMYAKPDRPFTSGEDIAASKTAWNRTGGE